MQILKFIGLSLSRFIKLNTYRHAQIKDCADAFPRLATTTQLATGSVFKALSSRAGSTYCPASYSNHPRLEAIMRRMIAASSSVTSSHWRRRAAPSSQSLGLLVLMLLLLALDLATACGLAWQVHVVTDGRRSKRPDSCEASIEVAGNLIRAPLVRPSRWRLLIIRRIVPYGINTFLEQEVERPKIEAMLRMISDAGFVWLRQEFPWEDLEVDGRGQYSDSRDLNGDGQAGCCPTPGSSTIRWSI